MTDISVVIPAFNAHGTVTRAVKSILHQTLAPTEVIIVDDGSTDGTFDALSSLRDPRIRVLRRNHQGVASAANAGTLAAKSPLIARMDADDFSHPHRLAKQYALLQRENLDVCGCQVRIIDELGQPSATMDRYQQWINVETPSHDQIAALRFVELPIVNPTILARRAYFELGFRDIGFPEDYDLMLRAAAKCMRFGKVDDVLLDWTDRPERLTRTDSNFSDAAFMRCRKTHLLAGPLAGANEVDIWGVGKTGKPWMRWLLANRINVRNAYDIDERKIGETIHGAKVHHGNNLPTAGNTPLIIAVGAKNARQTIRPQLDLSGYVMGINAWFVA